MKANIWNKEFNSGRWDCLVDTGGDPIYSFILKYSNNGEILDLGCGSGNTGNELDLSAYSKYTGIDISDAAIKLAADRSCVSNRSDNNQYIQADISQFVPQGNFDIILFRESIYYLSVRTIRKELKRYATYLKETGIFIVRVASRNAAAKYIEIIKGNFDVLDEYAPEGSELSILVFR